MKKTWTTLKSIIGTYEQQKGIFLSLIDENGNIVSANANMKKTLHLKKTGAANFFELLHPVNVPDFKAAVNHAENNNTAPSMELYLKNGYYHPMKWQVNFLKENNGAKEYLCVGHKILDDERLKQFNLLGEKNYQLIVESINAGILFQDRRGELIAVNYKAAEIFNSTLERLYQLTDIANLWDHAWTITTEEGEPVTFEKTPFMKALTTGQTQTEVLVIKLKNGEQRWIHFSSQPLFEENGVIPFSVVSNIVDLTVQKKLVLELRKRKAMFRSFMDQTPNMAWVVDEDSNLIFANHAFYQYFGIDEKKAIDKKITDIVPVAAEALYEKHMQVLSTGTATELIEKVKWANGTEFVFHINIFPIEQMGERKLLGGHAVNLSEKHNIERRLRETNDRLLLLTRATSDAIWEWDMQTGHIFRNDALMDMIGYQTDDPRGLSWWLRRIHPDDRNRVSDKVKESTDNNQQSWEDQYRFKCADGHYKFMRDKGYIVYENGLPVKMIGSLQDVSDIKQLESQLMEEKLERQKEVSEMVIHVQEKERTRMGHELHDNVNQILSTAKLFADMLTPSGNDQKKIKDKSIEYIMMAIEEIRKLSKELVVPQLKEKGLLSSIESLIEDTHLTTAVKIKFIHDHENEYLSPGKKVALFRIVQEQLKNILKHSQAKCVDIYLESKEDTVQLVIRDNGVGFDPKQTHRGIGLSNIFERTRFYNGSVDIQTKPGAGCLLTVNMPIVS